ncbi:TusE/DsrC/DsvC family sulfur relay protein [Acidiferrobacter sp. SPIII_3]|jgi:tRNA 2-thiouridine synthesizing protein E|uniref:TusE/DsrC/DsvC family sulfur relay protein n=1 Tax=Acidiferrobacter sp. SPIII_3 TaxID=1281578 RepID=UPI00197ACAFF|nr:TusE/DsrC/DsvC family sulfur relay protein [Acidiferrobacter sp. SPIII_3]
MKTDSGGYMELMVGDARVVTDDEGYLIDPGDWSESVAEVLARSEGLALNGDHWEVIRFVRAFFDEHQVTPDARFAIRHLADHGMGAKARARLFELFPYGYVKQACKVAGMRRPRGWSTG